MVVHSWGTFVYAPPECKQESLILLPEEEAHHLHHVLRRQSGAEVFATDGAGFVHRCSVVDSKRLKIEASLPEFGEPMVDITLAVGLLKGDGNRDLVDAATQLGARRIVFIQSIRSEGMLSENKLTRLRKIAVSAIKQCGRARLPELLTVDSVGQSLEGLDVSTRLLLAQQLARKHAKNLSATARQPVRKLMVYVGPEGGFDAGEIEMLRAAGAELVHLGGRRLRTATAVCAALSYCLGMTGEMS
ncbi:16S rRNA (uracil(1498)-N(3))-methyltransferase [bacterium]|nr:16S rRNA (uracil(1498)-N(3))-methyltransferase [bacterium]MBU1919368.1 16S rRNA (uracil(1498)-N(3))-methyltransferase [bacterium]